MRRIRMALAIPGVVALVVVVWSLGQGGPSAQPAPRVEDHGRHVTAAVREDSDYRWIMTANVEISDDTILPAVLMIPVGQQTRLVLRNRGQSEHHYHVLGLPTTELLWLDKAAARESSNVDHASHHTGNMVPYHICTSRSGLCPTGFDVHSHADPGDVDVIMFTPTSPGGYTATDPLNPALTAKVIVF